MLDSVVRGPKSEVRSPKSGGRGPRSEGAQRTSRWSLVFVVVVVVRRCCGSLLLLLLLLLLSASSIHFDVLCIDLIRSAAMRCEAFASLIRFTSIHFDSHRFTLLRARFDSRCLFESIDLIDWSVHFVPKCGRNCPLPVALFKIGALHSFTRIVHLSRIVRSLATVVDSIRCIHPIRSIRSKEGQKQQLC